MAPAASGTAPLLPPALTRALRRILRSTVLGAALLAVLVVAAMILAYVPSDPSLNRATGAEPENLFGLTGAMVADIALQSLGYVAAVPLLVLTSWLIRALRGGTVGWLWLRGLALIGTCFLLAMAFGFFVEPGDGFLAGGFVGALLLEGTSTGLQSLTGAAENLRPVVGLVAALAGAALFAWTVHIRGAEIAAVLDRLWALGMGLALRLRQKTAESVPTRTATAPPPPWEDEEEDAPAPAAAPAPPAPAKRKPAAKRVEAPAPASKAAAKRDMAARQGSLLKDTDGSSPFPPLDILALPSASERSAKINEDALEENARVLESVLEDFGVRGQITAVRPGPVVTLYELEPAAGTKTQRVVGLADDIARSMSAVSARIAVVPGKNVIGIELPNAERQTVYFREALEDKKYERSEAKLCLALGKDIGGAPVYADLAKMPHLLIAGTTGSGKSVAVNTMILSLLYRLTPDQCRLIMIDPKMLELSVYDGIPHLLTPVVTDPGKAVMALKWAVREMETRYRAMSQLGVRNIAGYNQRVTAAGQAGEVLTKTVQTGFDPDTGEAIYETQNIDLTPLPFIVVIVDEMADLMLVAGKDVEAAIQRLAQMARAAGIHLIMATQRPSVDVITGTIKANFPTRISFQVTSKIDSRTILGEQGAEQLLGQGDMLYMAAGGRVQRVHGPFVSDGEVEAVVQYLCDTGAPEYLESVTEEQDVSDIPGMAMGEAGGGAGGGNAASGDAQFDQAVDLVARERKASTSFIQRHLRIGYNSAARIIEEMEAQGMVSKANHVGKREVLLPPPADMDP